MITTNHAKELRNLFGFYLSLLFFFLIICSANFKETKSTTEIFLYNTGPGLVLL